MKLKNKIARVVCVALILTMLACALSSCSQSTDVPEGMKIATCEGENFRIYIPEAWTSTASIGISGGYALSTVRSNVSLSKYNSAAAGASDFLSEFADKCKAKYSDFTFVENASGLIGDKGAISASYTFTDNEASLKMLLMAVAHDGAFYLFTYVADISIYDRYLDTAIDVAEKVKFDAPYESGLDGTASGKAPEGMKLASGKNFAYKLFVPEAWTVGGGEITTAYVESDKSNVSVTEYVPDTDIMSIDQYWEMCKTEYEKYMTDYVAISERGEGKLGKRLAYVYEFSAKVDGAEYKFLQAIAVNGSKICVLTYTATPECYDLHRADVDRMMSSFEFK